MHHLDEHTLEMFVLLPDRFAPEQLAEIRAHLHACPGCRAVEAGLRQFHAALREGEGVDPALVRRMMDEILPAPRVIRLHQYRARPDARIVGAKHTTVLAAMSPKPQPHTLHGTVATLASETNQTLVRIRREGREHAYRLYVLADDPRKRDSVLVTLPPLGEFVTDTNGQVAFELEAANEPIDWGEVEGLLKLPLAMFSFLIDELPLDYAFLRSDEEGKAGYTVTVEAKDSRLYLDVRGEAGAGVPSVALIRSAAGALLAPLDKGSAAIALTGEEGSVVVRLYS